MDWRDALDRLKASRAATSFLPLLDRIPVGRRLMLVSPITDNPRSWRAPWTELVRRRGAQFGRALQADRRFRCNGYAPTFYKYGSTVSVRAVLCQKVRA
jgi:mannosyltransferase